MEACPRPNAIDRYMAMRLIILWMAEEDGIKPPVVAMGKNRSRKDNISPNVIALCSSKEELTTHAKRAYKEWLCIIGDHLNNENFTTDRDTQRSPDRYRGNWILGLVSGI